MFEEVDFEKLLERETRCLDKLDSDGDPPIFSLLVMTIATGRLGNMEHARRLAVLSLRKVQRNKSLPNRAFYLSLSKALHACVFNKALRSRLLLARIEPNAKQLEKHEEKVLLAAAYSLII